MIYASVGIMALLVQFIINNDVFKKSSQATGISALAQYRLFLLGVSLYYLSDILWGLFDGYKLISLLYADTVVYFFAMALSVFLWTRYVVHYLNEKTRFISVLSFVGWLFMLFETALIIANFFTPVLFCICEDGTYIPGGMRYATFIIQIVLFILTSVYSLVFGLKVSDGKRKHRTVGFFGLGMSIFIGIQIFNPLLPLYSMGCLIGTSLLHAFVHEEEKLDYLKTLSEQKLALGSAKDMAYTDPLTGIKNKFAYIEDAGLFQYLIDSGERPEFAIAVFDINGLKIINDELGHEAGDRYILAAKDLICGIFSHSIIYRIGGDEFVSFLTDDDYKNRNDLIALFNRKVEENMESGRIAVSAGISDFDPDTDKDCAEVFRRADKLMYENKQRLKEKTHT